MDLRTESTHFTSLSVFFESRKRINDMCNDSGFCQIINLYKTQWKP